MHRLFGRLSLGGATAGLLGSVLYAAPAHGDDREDRTTAQQLFDEGKRLIADGNIPDACAKFAAAAELSPTVGVRLNLGECYVKMNRPASAWARFGDALTIAERVGDVPAAGVARARRDDMTPLLSYLTVNVSPGNGSIAGFGLYRDGIEVPETAWGSPVPVDPGIHDFRAYAPGHVGVTITQAIPTKPTTAAVSIPVLSVDLIVERAKPKELPSWLRPPPAPIDPYEDGQGLFGGPQGKQHAIAVGSWAGSVVSLGVSGALGLVMLADKTKYKANEDDHHGQCDTLCVNDSINAVNASRAANIALAASGAFAATGVAVWMLAPKHSESDSAPALVIPEISSHSAVLSVKGAF